MFIAENQLKWFLYGLKSVQKGGFILLEIDKAGKMVTQEDAKILRQGHRGLRIIGFMTISAIIEIYYETSHGGLSVPDLFLCLFLLSMQMIVYYAQKCLIGKRRQIAAIFNHAITFERQQNPRNWAPGGIGGLLAKGLVNLALIPCPVALVAYVGQVMLLPCLPAHLGYFFHPQCPSAVGTVFESLQYSNIFSKTLIIASILVVSWYCVSFTFPAYVFELTFSYLVCHCSVNYLKLLMWKLGHLTPKTKNWMEEVNVFRQIQLMIMEFNEYHQKHLCMAKLYQLAAGLVLSLFAIVRLWNVLVVPQKLIFVTATVEFAVQIMFVFGTKANLYLTSKVLMTQVKNMYAFRRNRWFRKYTNSWPVLKVYLGSGNFIDELTPLVVMNFVLAQLVNILLL